MVKVRIYTKTGDNKKTSLMGGKRVLKDNQRVSAYGNLDELNAAIGLALSFITDTPTAKVLKKIQLDLFDIGSELSNPHKVGAQANKLLTLKKDKIKWVEKTIDHYDSKLPVLKNFILPGGSKAASHLHLSRSICRRAERSIVSISGKEDVNPNILVYINRLSDLLFVLARYTNKQAKVKEILWRK